MYSLQLELKTDDKLVASRLYATTLKEVEIMLPLEFIKIKGEFNKLNNK